MEELLKTTDQDIQKYVEKKKRTVLSTVLMEMGVETKFPICYPIKICFEDLNTDENDELLDKLSENDLMLKYFNCRSLRSGGKKDKKRIQNVIKQMIAECGLNIKRTPHTYYNELTGEKKTKQFYVISQ